MAQEPQLLPDAAYWIRTLRPWKGELVAVGLCSGRVVIGLLVDATAEGPVLEVVGKRKLVGRWQDVRSVETATGE